MMRFSLLVVSLGLSASAAAQSWPQKPLRYIVPFPPGAFNDTLARTLSAELQKPLGQPVIVENRPGGNTIIATELAAKSPPDGYTLYGAALPFSVIQSLYKTSFDVTKDFAPITLAGVTPNLLVANTNAPVSSVQGADRLRQGQSRQAELRLHRQRHLEPPVVRAVQGDDRHQRHAHPLQGQRAGGDRPHRRPGAGDVRQHAERAAARALPAS